MSLQGSHKPTGVQGRGSTHRYSPCISGPGGCEASLPTPGAHLSSLLCRGVGGCQPAKWGSGTVPKATPFQATLFLSGHHALTPSASSIESEAGPQTKGHVRPAAAASENRVSGTTPPLLPVLSLAAAFTPQGQSHRHLLREGLQDSLHLHFRMAKRDGIHLFNFIFHERFQVLSYSPTY